MSLTDNVKGDDVMKSKDKFGTKGWFVNHKILSVILAFVALLVIVSIANGGNKTTSSTTASTTPTTQPQQSTAKSTPAPAKPVDTHPHFGDGTFKVGTDIQPGTYRTRTGSTGCYWERMADFTGGSNSILANDNTDAPAVVTILSTDAGFTSKNCGTWTEDLSAITTSQTTFGDGIYIVGTDIQPGTYKSSGQTGCYWERMADFTGGSNTILANDNTDTSAIVTIAATDKGFDAKGCGTWTMQ